MTDDSADGGATPKILVTALPEGREVTTYFVCTDKEAATDRNGKGLLRLKLRDASGELKAIHFDPDEAVVASLANGDVVKVSGTYSVHAKYGQQFQVRRLRVMEPGEYDMGTLVPVSPVPRPELERRLGELIGSVADPALRALLERVRSTRRANRVRPSLSCPPPCATITPTATACSSTRSSSPRSRPPSPLASRPSTAISRSPAPCVHDIGKVKSYSADPMNPGFTDAGRLHGEIVIGHDIVRGLIDEIPGFPPELATQLRHIVVSHHGEREKGSPVVPATREAIIVHFCDDMTARIAAIDEVAARTAAGERWSAWVNMLDSYSYLPSATSEAVPVAPVVAVAEPEPAPEPEPGPETYGDPLDEALAAIADEPPAELETDRSNGAEAAPADAARAARRADDRTALLGRAGGRQGRLLRDRGAARVAALGVVCAHAAAAAVADFRSASGRLSATQAGTTTCPRGSDW